MPKSIAITSYHSVGGTFIDWSIHFLNNRDSYFDLNNQTWNELSSNPITDVNAHGHKKNHPFSISEVDQYFANSKDLDHNDLISFYAGPEQFDIVANAENIDLSQFSNPEIFALAHRARVQRYNQFVQYLVEKCNKLIVIDYKENLWSTLYLHQCRAPERFLYKPGIPGSETDLLNETQEVFFSNSINTWKELGLTEVWDIRERIALDTRLVEPPKENLVLTAEHYWISAEDFWLGGRTQILDIMKFLDLDIDQERYAQWINIFCQWQNIQAETLKFSATCKHIVDSIVNGNYFPLPKLTFNQEAIIQHLLLYRYNLNLKTWQLSVFPANTRDLHNLIEPNIHQLDNSYIELLTHLY